MPIATLNRVRLHYEVCGVGRDIVLCHGFSGSHQDWFHPIADLAHQYRVIAMDHRGHGSSQAPTSPAAYSIKAFAQDVVALMGVAGVKRCCLWGHSMGGFIALEIALSHPELVAALVLVDTSSGEMDLPAKHRQARQEALELLVAKKQGTTAAFEYVATHSPYAQEYYQRHPYMREVSRQRTGETSVKGYIHGWKAIQEWAPLTPRLGEIKVPTLIIVGEEDTGFLRPAQGMKQGIPRSRLVLIPGSGHSPHIEQPAAFRRAVGTFLSRHYPPA